MVIDNVIIELY